MVFHKCSESIYNWLVKQAHVKEESLTDWLLYYISENCKEIYYQAFSRHEETNNGADWEWWVLTPDSTGSHTYNAYRFLVQAKKLVVDDNYSRLSYNNKNGLQIDLLLKSAKKRKALPMYMYYSTVEPDIKKQIKNLTVLEEDVIRWCEDCINGCYLSLASDVYKLLYGASRHKLLAVDVLSYSFKLSLCDLAFKYDSYDVDKFLSDFNIKLMKMADEKEELYMTDGVHGIKHYGKGIPDYLSVYIDNKGEKMDWFESEMRIEGIDGIGVIDFRDKEEEYC